MYAVKYMSSILVFAVVGGASGMCGRTHLTNYMEVLCVRSSVLKSVLRIFPAASRRVLYYIKICHQYGFCQLHYLAV